MGPINTQIYKNGVAFGPLQSNVDNTTRTYTLTFNRGDSVQLFVDGGMYWVYHTFIANEQRNPYISAFTMKAAKNTLFFPASKLVNGIR